MQFFGFVVSTWRRPLEFPLFNCPMTCIDGGPSRGCLYDSVFAEFVED